MMPSRLAWSLTYESARKPELPAVKRCPEKRAFSESVLMSFAVSALPVPAKADATPTRAENPLLDADGSVIAKLNWPALALFATSFQVTLRLPSQPKLRAVLAFTPSTTGESMIRCWARIFLAAPGSKVRYRLLENHASGWLSPALIACAPSRVPM